MTEAEFLKAYKISDYDVPLTTVDIVIFAVHEEEVQVLLVERPEHPERGKLALPGGFVKLGHDASIESTAFRKLMEKTGVKSPYLEQVTTIGNATRDPRGWSLTVLYFALINYVELHNGPNIGSEPVRWAPLSEALKMKLAFDHKNLLATAVNRLRSKTRYSALPLQLMPEEFTLSELQHMFEIVLGAKLEKKSFRRRFLASGLLEDTEKMKSTGHRPASIYRRIEGGGGDFVFPGLLDTKPKLLDTK